MARKKNAPRFDVEKFDMYKNFDFVKLDCEKIPSMLSKLSNSEIAVMIKLSMYVPYNGRALCHRNGKLLDKEHIMEICGISGSTYKRIVNALSEKNVLRVVKDNKSKLEMFYLNPFLIKRGDKIDKNVKKLFELMEVLS